MSTVEGIYRYTFKLYHTITKVKECHIEIIAEDSQQAREHFESRYFNDEGKINTKVAKDLAWTYSNPSEASEYSWVLVNTGDQL